jgi:hypothetical protein
MATHFAYRQTRAAKACLDEFNLFATSRNGYIGGEERLDLWVVDVAGTTLVVYAGATGEVPARFQAELDAVVASVELVTHD